MVNSEIHLCVKAYQELAKDRIYYEGVPSPITYTQLDTYHSRCMPAVRFYLLKAIVAELDVYEMAKYNEARKQQRQRSKVK